jgi:hypothetical protein
VIHVSKHRLTEFGEMLLGMLPRESDEANRRHIVRALGNLGTPDCTGVLLTIVRKQAGLIVGDAIEALGKLKAAQAIEDIRGLTKSPTDWIANKARWALKQLEPGR